MRYNPRTGYWEDEYGQPINAYIPSYGRYNNGCEGCFMLILAFTGLIALLIFH